MKTKLLVLFIIFSGLLLHAEDMAKVPVDENQSIEELLNTNSVAFDFIVDGRSAKAYLICDKGKFECGFIGSWQTYVFQRVEYVNAELCNVYFMVSTEIFDTPDYNFDKLETGDSGYSGYTHWGAPTVIGQLLQKQLS